MAAGKLLLPFLFQEIVLDERPSDVYIVGNMADLLGTFEQIVLLAIVRLQDNAYGRSVLRDIELAFSGSRTISAGAVYATLDRLEQKGLLTSELGAGTAERGGRQRRFYRLTANGCAALNEAKSTLDFFWQSCRWPLEVHP